MLSIGQILKQARTKQGRTLEEMEQQTKIRAYQLGALEREDFEVLPSLQWAKGITISYANYLGLDGIALAEEFFSHPPSSRPKRFTPRQLRERITALLTRHRRKALAATSGAIIAVVVLVATAILFPYNGVTGGVSSSLHARFPQMFLGEEPQRFVVLASTGTGATGEDTVMTMKVAQDGVRALTIPGNTLVEVPGHGKKEINAAFALGGPDLTRQTVARLAGVEVQHYLAIDAEGIKTIVNSTGGMQIDVPNHLNGKASIGGSNLTLHPGPQILNGDQALVYLQGADLPSDVERAERQQAFVRSLLGQALDSGNLLRNPTTVSTMSEHVQTNMNFVEAIGVVARLRGLERFDAAGKAHMLPGWEMAISPQQATPSNSYWVMDTRELPHTLERTLR